MGRKVIWPPRKKEHLGRDRVWWNGRYHDLGKAGTAEAKAEHGRLIALWAVDPTALALHADDFLVSELCEEFSLSNAMPADGRQRGIALRAIKLLCQHHAETPVLEFGPLALAAWQSWLCRQCYMPPLLKAGVQRWNRTYIGHLMRVVRSIWKWGVASERLPEDRYRSLMTVPGPRYGECREPIEVTAADPSSIDAVLPLLRGPVRAMLLLQRATGARPSELLLMRPRDVHRSGRVRLPRTGTLFDIDAEKVWVLLPAKHKGTSRRKLRAIFFGAREQKVLKPFLDRPADAFCFDPREAAMELREEQRQSRLARGGGSGGNRKKPKGMGGKKRQPGSRYTHVTYGQAVRRACLEAGVASFAPYQIRHLVGEEVDLEHGLDGARDVLGHSDPRTTTRYAKASAKRAAEIARKRGRVSR